jgi:hypothetical protein
MNLSQNHLGQLSLLEDSLKVLGSENLTVLYHHLERFGVKRDEIMDKPAEFSNALRSIFGQAASILESQIVSSITAGTGQGQDSDITLSEALKQLKELGPPGSA